MVVRRTDYQQAFTDLRARLRSRRAFWWAKDEALRTANRSCVEPLRALAELDWIDASMRRAVGRQRKALGRKAGT